MKAQELPTLVETMMWIGRNVSKNHGIGMTNATIGREILVSKSFLWGGGVGEGGRGL